MRVRVKLNDPNKKGIAVMIENNCIIVKDKDAGELSKHKLHESVEVQDEYIEFNPDNHIGLTLCFLDTGVRLRKVRETKKVKIKIKGGK